MPPASTFDLTTPRFHRRFAWMLPLALVACQHEKAEELSLQVGPEQLIRFEPKSAFARYYELPGQRDRLQIVLSSYPVGCHEYSPPPKGEVFVTLTLQVPAESLTGPGRYTWKGLPPLTDDESEANSEKQDEDEESRDTNKVTVVGTALPFVRLAEEGRLLLPGGDLILEKFEKEPFGLVEGQLAFRDGPPGQISNTALGGHFSLRLCHVDLDPARATLASKPD